MLKKFYKAIKPFDKVKIIEKDTSADLLAATTPVVEEETKMIEPKKKVAAAKAEEPMAQPRFPLVVKINRPNDQAATTKSQPNDT